MKFQAPINKTWPAARAIRPREGRFIWADRPLGQVHFPFSALGNPHVRSHGPKSNGPTGPLGADRPISMGACGVTLNLALGTITFSAATITFSLKILTFSSKNSDFDPKTAQKHPKTLIFGLFCPILRPFLRKNRERHRKNRERNSKNRERF